MNDLAFDVSRFLFPIDKKEIFGNEKPLALEIGFGEGEFLINAASQDKSRNYLGIEIKRGRFRKALRTARKLSLENLKFVHIEAAIALRQIFSKNTFDLAFVNFPDPWPKKKHLKHRIFNGEFISHLSEALCAGGRIVIKTDQLGYIEQIVSEFEKSALFRPVYAPAGFIEAGREEPKTKFERLFRENSQRIYIAALINFSARENQINQTIRLCN